MTTKHKKTKVVRIICLACGKKINPAGYIAHQEHCKPKGKQK